MVHVFTSAAPNYLGKVRALFHSLARLHPEIVLHLALADRTAPELDLEREPFDDLVLLGDLPEGRDAGWLFSHSIVELSTAIKGSVACHLLEERGAEKVFYFDPDIVAFSRLDDLIAALDGASAVLTPHLCEPEVGAEAIADNEICALKHGVFNLGFLGVANTAEGRRVAGWWRDRLHDYCRAEIAEGLFTDQRWFDLAPCFFPGVRVVRDSRFNVASWNINQRRFEGTFDEGFRVDGKPLGFYHFTGFDSGAHQAMLGKYADGNESLGALVDWYRRRTATLAEPDGPWTLGVYDDGKPISDVERRIYRVRPDLKEVFPDPFVTGGEEPTYRRWFRDNAAIEYPDLVPARAAAEPVHA